MANSNRIIPKGLRPGSRIGIAAPAGYYNVEKFEAGIKVLENLGFKPIVPSRLSTRKGYLAGDDAHRISVIHRLFADPSVDAILCARGGYGSMRILPLIDFSIIRHHPKIFIGFSDITALLTVFYTHCALVTYHGPVVTSLGRSAIETGETLVSAVSCRRRIVIKPENGFVLNPGKAVGPVIGGNLTILSHLIGTPYAPRYDGHILFLEDCNEKPYRIDRMLTQMRLSGCLNDIAGLFLGQFTDCDSLDTIKAIVTDIFHDKDIPMMGGFEIGHERTNLTLPIGLFARLNTRSGQLTYLEPPIS
jgi:muramoyltetrapeptide carboxypeptidase